MTVTDATRHENWKIELRLAEELMGWPICRSTAEVRRACDAGPGYIRYQRGKPVHIWAEDRIWEPAEDIRQALRVIEAANSKGWVLTLVAARHYSIAHFYSDIKCLGSASRKGMAAAICWAAHCALETIASESTAEARRRRATELFLADDDARGRLG